MILIFVLFVFAASVCVDWKHKPLFNIFLQKWPKNYATENEYSERYETFCKNVEVAELMNDIHPDTTYGITKFMDLSPEEFQSTYLMKPFSASEFKSHNNFEKVTEYPSNGAPDAWDWRDHGLVTDVKNQLQCGSCWAFSAVANIEGQIAKTKGSLVSLSEQQLVDCDKKDKGCDGGIMDDAFQYIIDAGGIETFQEYPYEGFGASCKFEKDKINATISSFKDLSHDEGDMLEWSYANGPISIALNANDLQYYTGGVFDPISCNPEALDHGVTITGWGIHKGLFSKKDFWWVKNSWGTDWGLKGYFMILRGKGKCGLNKTPCTAVV